MDKRYRTLSKELCKIFGGKTAKICINAGFSCPNRERNGEGCLFCSESGGAGFSNNVSLSIKEQINNGKKLLAGKWNPIGYIAYFQNYSNTYAVPAVLRKRYEEALSMDGIVGLAVATRPDCLGNEVLDLLEEYNERTFLWIEMGLQTSNRNTAELVNRGYENHIYEKAVFELEKRNINHVVHLIAGLPGEKKSDFIESVRYINKYRPWGIKFHNIYIQRNSPLYSYSLSNDFKVLTLEQYTDWVTDAIMNLNKTTIIHRLTGDPDRRLLHEPVWIKNKLRVLSEIDRALKEKNGFQGTLNCY